MTKNIFYLVGQQGGELELCVLEPRPGQFLKFKIDVASLSRLMLEAAPHVHEAIAAQIADQNPAP